MDTQIISAASALAGVAQGQVLTRNGEDRRWIRDERRHAAAELLPAAQAMWTIFVERAATSLQKDPDSTEPTRQEAIRVGEERLVLAMATFQLMFPAPVIELAEGLCESARAIRHIRLDKSPDIESPGFEYLRPGRINQGSAAGDRPSGRPRPTHVAQEGTPYAGQGPHAVSHGGGCPRTRLRSSAGRLVAARRAQPVGRCGLVTHST